MQGFISTYTSVFASWQSNNVNQGVGNLFVVNEE